MHRRFMAIIAILFTFTLSGCSDSRLSEPLWVASGFTSHLLCSESFISGQSAQEIFIQRIQPNGLMWLLEPLMRFEVDRNTQEARTSIAGQYETRAVYREQLGCVLTHEPQDAQPIPIAKTPLPPALLPEIAGPAIVQTAADAQGRGLSLALDHAFAERPGPPYKHTKAVLVLHRGRLVAERYAPGYGVDTPILGFSATKSITNALLGILVRKGQINMQQPTRIAAWQDQQDERHTITPDMLLRHTSGLALTQDNSGFDVSSRMSFMERDLAGFAQGVTLEATPGTRWAYTDGNFMLLSRLIRDAVGGSASDVLQFSRRELFGPLGMQHTLLEFDATGTPMGTFFAFASARDWARFGQFFLNDGVAGDTRILPEGWVTYSSTPTLHTSYGAGFWVNGVEWENPWGGMWNMPDVPSDAFFAQGHMGQYVIIIPSQHLVVVRLGSAIHSDGYGHGMNRLVREIIAALAM